MDTTKTITHVSLCARYGGIDLGLSRAIPNLRTIAFSEIEAFACANLVSKMEAGQLEPAPIWTNLKTFPWSDFRDRVDILSGGYPCQPFSAAGKRLGKDDPRHLWPWIADGIRTMRPRVCFFENVEGHISLGLREVISELESIGYKATWGIFSAREVGAPHQRKRVFILAERSGERGSARFSRQIAWKEGVARIFDDCRHQAWPSRPGQPQHGWEPPRVVGDSTGSRQQAQRDESIKEWEKGSFGKSGQLGNSINNGSHQRSEETRGQDSSSEQGRMQESEGGSASVGDTEHDGLHGATPGRCYEADARSWSEEESEVEQQRQGAGGVGSEICTVMGNSTEQRCERSGRQDDTRLSTFRSPEPNRSCANGSMEPGQWQAQPSLGGDSDGSTNRMDDAELFVTSDNRTDELRLLGNGVVPATATRAFIVLINQLLNQ